MKYRVKHVTSYGYAAPVDLSHHILHLRPRSFAHQHVHHCTIEVTPPPSCVAERRDHFGNGATLISVEVPHRTLQVAMIAGVDVRFPDPPLEESTTPWEQVRDRLRAASLGQARYDADAIAAAEFAVSAVGTHIGVGNAGEGAADAAGAEALAAFAAPFLQPGAPVLTVAREMTRSIAKDFTFDPHATTVTTPVAEILAERRGVCQDFAHVQIAALRSAGLAARYVSGYIRTVPLPGHTDLRGADASHAWVSVWCGDAGWIDLDPTNDLVVKDEHIVVAWGRDFGDVSPIRGIVLGGGAHSLTVAVETTPLPQEVTLG